jgi:signal transduction histidine kinase
VAWWARTLWPYVITILLIGLLDAITPSQVFAGTLLVVPILAASRTDQPQVVYLLFAVAMVSLLISMVIARSAGYPAALWLPNRAIEIVALPGSTFLALALQRQRIDARRARNRADQARGVSEILSSLVAHDLRAPIATTLHALRTLEQEAGGPERTALIGELRSRLTRSLLVGDAILGAAQAGLGVPAARERGADAAELARGLQGVARAFEAEAAGRGKQIELDVGPLGDGIAFVNTVALYQSLTIVLDNAVRYAVPGTIRISTARSTSVIEVAVTDQGPGLSAGISSEGARMGLDLCRAMLRKAGGDLEVARDAPDGTTFRIRLPDHVTGGSARG